MGAPSENHESRVRELETLAVLAGFTEWIAFDWRLRPDLVRWRSVSGALFVGDAKETESPGCGATSARLRWYLIDAASRQPSSVVFALAVSSEAPVRAWAHAMTSAARSTGWHVASMNATALADTVVVAGRVRRAI